MASLAAPSTKRTQPPWTPPPTNAPLPHPDLKVYNSLTSSKVKFVPRDGNNVGWYACGPTVYDDSHLGHARNYVSTDIIRRIMQDYFKFNVKFVMNITDVDDKIILRARQRHLFEEWKKEHRYVQEEEREIVRGAYNFYIKKNLPLLLAHRDHHVQEEARETARGHNFYIEKTLPLLVLNQDQSGVSGLPPSPQHFNQEVDYVYGQVLQGKAMDHDGRPGDKEAKIKMHINTIRTTVKALTADPKSLTPHAFYEMVSDVMCLMLDNMHGKSIKGSDHAIFTKLTKEYEHRFFKDMRDLNVLPPDEITRVTEYGAEIATFVEVIMKNKLAYATSDGSVYFDIQAFEAASYPYARLKPESRGDTALQADGEGALSQDAGGKRSDADFALWKASKPGEPSWPSSWGLGRPGWHIECSAMAVDKLGSQMDIHSGGIDLAFPHHDNELAQSEAFFMDPHKSQWVNYFLHMGHLSIQGSKMSKSLKNFTTIRTALERKDWTPRSLRIVFLLGSWKDGIEITDDIVLAGASWEDKVDNFFIKTREPKENFSTSSESQQNLQQALQEAKAQVYEALCDSFNTPAVMAIISSLITKVNSVDRPALSFEDARSTGLFVTKMVNIFGLNGNGPAESQEVGWDGLDIPDVAKPYVYPLAEMRDELRQAAIAKQITPETVEKILHSHPPAADPAPENERRVKSYVNMVQDFRAKALQVSTDGVRQGVNADSMKDASKQILTLCDRVRDFDLWKVDIYLEDRDGAPAIVRPVTRGLKEARREQEEKSRAREEARTRRDREQRDKLEKGRLSHLVMFKPPQPIAAEFAEWDEEGMPTLTATREAVAKARLKKLRKDWERQKKLHEAYVEATASNHLLSSGMSQNSAP